MVPQKTDKYLMWGDHYVAWPLSVPSEHADWTLVSFVKNEMMGSVRLAPVRPLQAEEVMLIKRRPILYWGMKVSGCEWALVMWRPGYAQFMTLETEASYYDPSRSIGV